MIERRSRRAEVKGEALTMFLEEQRRRLRVRSVIVTTKEGRLLGAAGPVPGEVRWRESPALGTWELRAGDVDVVVMSHGGRLSYDLGMGVKRILTSS